MADMLSDFLERAEKAKVDPQIQAALTAEFAVPAWPEPEQPPLRASLDAAALLHWFGAGLLEQMLELSAEEAVERLEALKSLPFVERSRRSESELFNREATRLGWRRLLAHENLEDFRSKSPRSRMLCRRSDARWSNRTYLPPPCGDPERGAGE